MITCPFCKGKKTNISVDALNPDGTYLNPVVKPCLICEGTGEVEPEDDNEETE